MAEGDVEGGEVEGGDWSPSLPVSARERVMIRMIARAHARLIGSGGGLRLSGSAALFAFTIARVAISSASSLPGTLVCERT